MLAEGVGVETMKASAFARWGLSRVQSGPRLQHGLSYAVRQLTPSSHMDLDPALSTRKG